MSLYRCAACGSPNVIMDTQNGGVSYNYVKGTLGTVILGTGGAVAGIETKQQEVFKCPDCGLSLTYTMPENMRLAIDMCVLSFEARTKLKDFGIPVSWEFLRQKYKNIESGVGDERQKIETQLNRFERDKSLTAEEFDAAIVIIERYNDLLQIISTPEPAEGDLEIMQKEWESTAKWIENVRKTELEQNTSSLIAAKEAAIAQLEQERTENTTILHEQLSEQRTALSCAELELSELGVFSISKKKELKTYIQKLTTSIISLEKESDELDSYYGERIEEEKNKYDRKVAEITSQIISNNQIPEDPLRKQARISTLRRKQKQIADMKQEMQANGSKNEQHITNLEFQCIILLTLDEIKRKATIEEISNIVGYIIRHNIVNNSPDFTERFDEASAERQYISVLMRTLVREELVERTDGAKVALFELK